MIINKLLLKKLLMNITLLTFAASFSVFAAVPVDFYATVSSSNDSNMIRMTTDLFYTQMQTLDGYTVNDKRENSFTADKALASNISFFAEIQEDSDGGWICTLNALKKTELKQNKNVSSTKKYASYYKILLDAKSSLENLLENLNNETINTENTGSTLSENKTSVPPAETSELSELDSLAGTWVGENYIDKVIIMRGGRGFVIFKNGASMNVTVNYDEDSKKILVKQISRSNASFFPEIPRNLALQNAPKASEIIWEMSVTNKDTLEGTKKTLLEKKDSPGTIENGVLQVKWTKRINQ